MAAWLTELWKDFWERTVLFPPELGLLVVLVVLLQLPVARLFFRRNQQLRRMRQAFRRIANRRHLAVVLVFVFTSVGHFILDPGYQIPAPGFHDEYSYLLAADTFAHGRLTNPPHPMGFFFESFHILVEPTYMSMYPPGQGLALAAGTVLSGHPMAGVWLSVALACAAICWALQGWMPPQWALLGGLLAAMRIGWFSYWANSYWGGAVAMLGGALVYGAVPRLVRAPSRSAACWFAFGALVLMNTRPYEGVLVLIPACLWLVWRLIGQRRVMAGALRGPLLAVLLVGVSGLLWMGYYNWRITGDPLRMPYAVNRERYAIHKWFVGSPPDLSRTYNHPVIEQFYRVEEAKFRQAPYWVLQLSKPTNIWWFFIGPALTIPLLGLLCAWRYPLLFLPAAAVTMLLAGNFLVVWTTLPHYAAPATAAIYLLILIGWRHLITWRRKQAFSGASLVYAVFLACCGMAVWRGAAPHLGIPVYGEATSSWYSYGNLSNPQREKIERRLSELGGKHLVLVGYSPNHSPHVEWVYNRASIDDAPVVWSRVTADPIRMAQLLQYFRDRRVWIVYPDSNPSQVLAYK